MEIKNAGDVAFRLNMVANAEAGDGSKEFYQSIEMPDGRTAWDWIQTWAELRQAMEPYVGKIAVE